MYIIDRFEGSIAVIEDDDGKMIEVNRSLLPKNAKEGSVLIKNDDGSLSVDEKMPAERRRKLNAMQGALFGN